MHLCQSLKYTITNKGNSGLPTKISTMSADQHEDLYAALKKFSQENKQQKNHTFIFSFVIWGEC